MSVVLNTRDKIITGGIPAWRESSAAAKAVRGVISEGFMTTVQPHASAGPTWYKWETKQVILKMTYIHKKSHLLL